MTSCPQILIGSSITALSLAVLALILMEYENAVPDVTTSLESRALSPLSRKMELWFRG